MSRTSVADDVELSCQFEFQRQCFQAAQAEVFSPHQVLGSKADVRGTLQKRAECNRAFHASQRRAKTEMRSCAEGEVRLSCRPSRAVGIGKPFGITIAAPITATSMATQDRSPHIDKAQYREDSDVVRRSHRSEARRSLCLH